MTEILNVGTSNEVINDPRPQYFVKMFKDGSSVVSIAEGKEVDQCTMELEYIPQPPTDEEKIAYALTLPIVSGMEITDDLKRQVAAQIAQGANFVMPVFDPNKSRVHTDPDYFFKTLCKPVVWCWQHGTPEEAIAAAKAYLDDRLKVMKNGKSKWDMTIEVYKQQYNVVEG